MAGNVYWRGDTPAVSDVWTLTITGPATAPGNITVPYGDNSRSVTVAYATADTPDVMAGNLFNALSNSPAFELRELAWTYPGTGGVITGTGPVGVPVAIGTPTVTAATGVTCTRAHPTTATGPNFASEPKNWSTGTLPGTNAGEAAVIEGGADLLYGVDTWFSVANALTGLFWRGAVKGGLPRQNTTAGGTGYWEYRTRAVVVPTCPVEVGDDSRPGTDFLYLSLTDSTTVTVQKTGTPGDNQVACVDVNGTAGKTLNLNVYGGSAGLYLSAAPLGSAGTVAVSGTNTVAYINGGTVGTVQMNGGLVFDRSTLTTLSMTDGVFEKDAGSVTTITADSGTCRLLHTQGAALTAVFRGSVAGAPPVLDLSGNNLGPRNLANGSGFTGGAYVLDPFHTATLTTTQFDMQSLAASDIGRFFQVTRA